MEISILPETPLLVDSTSTVTHNEKTNKKSEATVSIPSAVKISSEPVIFTGRKCSSRIEVKRTECTSAVTGSVSSSEKDFHVVKIQISPVQSNQDPSKNYCLGNKSVSEINSSQVINKPKVSIVSFSESNLTLTDNEKEFPKNNKDLQTNSNENKKLNNIENINSRTVLKSVSEMVQKSSNDLEVNNPTYLYYMMTSGQCSPSDTLDSGTCSDIENGMAINTNSSTSPPPLPKKLAPKLKMHTKNVKIITQNQIKQCDSKERIHHKREGSFTDSEESESSLSCDSLNSSEFLQTSMFLPSPPPPPPNMMMTKDCGVPNSKISFLPDSLLRDIRDRKFSGKKEIINTEGPQFNQNRFKAKVCMKIANSLPTGNQLRDRNKTCVLITQENDNKNGKTFENDKFYTFHINERDEDQDFVDQTPTFIRDDESFAGYKDIHSGTSTIRSSKGTVRGVKNRVRNGIATFLQMQQINVKSFKEKDSGKVVLYTTSMGIVRETYAKCSNVKQILRTLLIKFEERDVFMSGDYQQEIKERMQSNEIQVPQLFVEGQHIGDSETVERLNESGELRRMLKPYKSAHTSITCQICGGYRLLPCPSCNGSKKSVHRNHFTAEFIALKCMNCDEVGLVKCHSC